MGILIDAALSYKRTVLMLLFLVIVSGIVAYGVIPKEESPDVTLPQLYVSTSLDGISAKDADKLLAHPIVSELEGIDGLNKIASTGAEGYAAISLEFDSDVDIDKALVDVREQVDRAKASLPDDAREPTITEINVALFPILVIALSGSLEDRVLFQVAESLQDRLETVPGVLEAKIEGDREEFAEVIVNPYALEAYNLNLQEVIRLISSNNRLVAAGALDTGQGRFSVNVPGLLESESDILNLPIKAVGDKIVTYRDIAVGRRAYKDPESFSRFNGSPTVSLEIVKRIGGNTINTIESVKRLIEESRDEFPEGLEVAYSGDESVGIRDSLSNLFNNVLSAALLVMLMAVVFIGFRNASLVGISIPCSFLTAILIVSLLGYTLNIVVLFALILSVGMLVDGAIVVTENADMRMLQGENRSTAYAAAAKRMSWPIITSTATTLAAFFPLLFWPDVTGDFMKYIPITVIITLLSALVMALIALPVLGSLIGKPNEYATNIRNMLQMSAKKRYAEVRGLTGYYLRAVDKSVHHPKKTLLLLIGVYVTVVFLYSVWGRGVEFFPNVEPDIGVVQVRARGDLSLTERDEIVREVEKEILKFDALETVYTTVTVGGGGGRGGSSAQDVIGRIQVEFADWRYRPAASLVMKRVERLKDQFPGVEIRTRVEQAGPPSDADIEIELFSDYKSVLDEASDQVAEYVRTNLEGIKSVRTTKPLPSIAWSVDVDREKASRFNVDIATLGSFVQMVTNGITLSDYLPEGAEDELDIKLRFPVEERNIDRLQRMRISAGGEQIPASNFIERKPTQRENEVTRINGNYAYDLQIDLLDGYRPDQVLPILAAILDSDEVPSQLHWKYRGTQEMQDKAASFLMRAFGVAFFMMLVIMVTQFNSFRQALLILSAIFFSTGGVFLGLLIRGEPFSIVMSGVGIIALAGIVVNNNIILIDTFNRLRARGEPARHAVLQTCAERFRPVILTTVTTVVGLMPMVMQLNLDFIIRDITVGAPSSQWWVQLSTAIAGGLAFSTVITLFFTPAMLYSMGRRQDIKQGIREVITAKSALDTG